MVDLLLNFRSLKVIRCQGQYACNAVERSATSMNFTNWSKVHRINSFGILKTIAKRQPQKLIDHRSLTLLNVALMQRYFQVGINAIPNILEIFDGFTLSQKTQ